MAVLHVALDALGAEHPLVEREVLPGLEADHLVVPHLELDPALLAAEAAVRLDQRVRRPRGLVAPAAGRLALGVRPVSVDQGVDGARDSSHARPRGFAVVRWQWSAACTRDTGPASAPPGPGCGSRTRARAGWPAGPRCDAATRTARGSGRSARPPPARRARGRDARRSARAA